MVLVEVIFFPGLLLLSIPGLCMIFGSLLWAMVDFWPRGTGVISLDMFIEPFVNLIFGMAIAVFGAILLSRVLKGSSLERGVVLEGAVGDANVGEAIPVGKDLPSVGAQGLALTQLFPSGRVEIDGQRYDARSSIGMIERASKIRVVGQDDFSLIVEEVSE